MGLCVSVVLHHCALFHTGIHHAEISKATCATQWVEKQSQAVTIHGADVHCHIYGFFGVLRTVCDEPDPIVVFQYHGDV